MYIAASNLAVWLPDVNDFIDTFLHTADEHWTGIFAIQVPDKMEQWVGLKGLVEVANRTPSLKVLFVCRFYGNVMILDMHGVFFGGRDVLRTPVLGLPRLRSMCLEPPDEPKRPGPIQRALSVFDKDGRRGWMDGGKNLSMGPEIGPRSDEELEIDRVLVGLKADDMRDEDDDLEWVLRACVKGDEDGVRVDVVCGKECWGTWRMGSLGR